MPVVSPDFNATTTWTGGGYDPNNPYAGQTGGGYDPTTGYAGTSNTIGGQAAVTDNMGSMPDYNAVQAGGWDPSMGDDIYTGGGYDPNAPAPAIDDPEAIRLAGTGGLTAGGSVGGPRVATSIGFAGSDGSISASEDWRVRIALSDNSKIFYKDTKNSMMAPLAKTNGVVFPYTPTVNISHTASYGSQQLTHSNYAQQFYQGSDVSDITISGEFTVQDGNEGQYLLATIYFLRAATKMFFGFDKNTGEGAGNPPPIVYLNGYGEHYFPKVPCVVTSFSHVLPNEVDYVVVPVFETTTSTLTTNYGSVDLATNSITGPNGETYVPSLLQSQGSQLGQTTQSTTTQSTTTTRTTRLPTSSTISISLRPVYSRKSLHEKFNLEDFAAGKLIAGSGGFL